MGAALLSAKHIRKSFDEKQPAILNDLSLDIHEGDFTVVMGPSGAGKSTLLYALSGMDEISDGQVFFRDQEISRMSEKALSKLRAMDFGFVFQQANLVSNLTLLENVVVPGYLHPQRSAEETRKRAVMLFEQMNVGDARNRYPAEVSGGEAQRAAVARAVINEPGLLFADEPTGALNRGNTEEVLELLTMLNQAGQSILMVTHDTHAAVRGNRLLYLEDGRIIGEKIMPAYTDGSGKAREAEINDWLHDLSW